MLSTSILSYQFYLNLQANCTFLKILKMNIHIRHVKAKYCINFKKQRLRIQNSRTYNLPFISRSKIIEIKKKQVKSRVFHISTSMLAGSKVQFCYMENAT